jgi:hypothetical protein
VLQPATPRHFICGVRNHRQHPPILPTTKNNLVLGSLLGTAASLLDDTVLDSLLLGQSDDRRSLGSDDEHVGL